MSDIARVKRNIQKMIDQGAPESDIDAYVAEEGLTPEALRAAPVAAPAAPPAPPSLGLQSALDAQAGKVTSETPKYGFGRGLMLGSQAVGKGLADVAGLVPDLSTAAANLALAGVDTAASVVGGGVDYRFPPSALGSEALSRAAGNAAEAAGLELVEPENSRERMMYNINRYGTQGLATGGLMARLGAATAPSNTPRLRDAFLKPYADAPVKTVMGDAASGAGAGVALTGSQEYLPQQIRDYGGGLGGTLADFLAMMAGGMAGTIGYGTLVNGPGDIRAMATAKRPAADVAFDPQTGAPVTNRAFEKAAVKMQSKAVDASAAVKAIDDAMEQAGGLPLPTTGLMTSDSGLIGVEQRLRTSMSGDSLAEGPNVAPATQRNYSFVERDKALRDAAVEKVNAMRPPDADPVALQQAAAAETRRMREEVQAANEAERARRQARVDTVEGRAEKVEALRREDALPIQPYTKPGADVEASIRLDDAVVNRSYLPDRANKNALYDNVDPARAEMVDIAPMAAAAAKVREQINQLGPQAQQLPAEFVQRVEKLAPKIEQQPSAIVGPDGGLIMREVNTGGSGRAAVGDIVDLQKYTGKARDTARQTGNFALADNLAELRAGANEAIENSPAAAAANSNYQENFAPKYRPGPGDEMAKFTKDIDRDGTRSTTPPEKTAARFLSSPEKAKALQRVLADSPAGAQGNAAVRDYLLSDLAGSGVLDSRSGLVRPDRLKAWRDRYGAQLDALPGFKEEVNGLLSRAEKGERVSGGLAKSIRDAQSKFRESERAAGRAERDIEAAINKSALSSVIDADADRAVFSIMRDPDSSQKKIDELLRLTQNNTDARDGLKASVADYFASKVSGVAPQNVSEGTQSINFAQLTKEFERHRPTLAKLYSPEEMNNLQQAQTVLAPLAKRAQQATEGSQTAERSQSFLRALEAGFKLYFGMLKGGGLTRTAKLILEQLNDGSAQAAERLIARAMFDPALAKQLLTANVKPPAGALRGPATGRLLRVGEVARQTTEED
jgi:hypothetical protein